MSDFWANKLANVRPVPRQEPVSAHRPWWDNSPAPASAPVQPVQQIPQGYPPQSAQPQYQAPPQAKSAQHTASCPECGSSDYFAPVPEGISVMNGPSRARCFSCGYPLSQTGSNGIKTQSGAGATPTRQIHDGSSQVNNTPFASIK